MTDHPKRPKEELLEVDIHLVDPNPQQPREQFDEDDIQSLASSLNKHNLLNRGRVIKVGSRYQLLGGERRLRAAKVAGWTKFPVVVIHRQPEEKEMLLDQAADHIHHRGYRPGENARMFQRLMDLWGWDSQALAEELSTSVDWIEKTVSLLKLPTDVLALVDTGDIPKTFAYDIAKLPSAEKMRSAAHRLIHEQLTAQQLEALVNRMLGKKRLSARNKRQKSRGTRKSLSVARGTRVMVISNKNLAPEGIVGAIFDAARLVHEEQMETTDAEAAPSLTIGSLLETMKTFRDTGPEVELAANMAIQGLGPWIAIRLLSLLEDEDRVVRRQAVTALNSLPREAKMALHHFAELLKPKVDQQADDDD